MITVATLAYYITLLLFIFLEFDFSLKSFNFRKTRGAILHNGEITLNHR